MESSGDIILFLGRWHPLLVHLPIGMLVMAFLFAVLSRKESYAMLAPAVPITLLFGAASAVFASISGYLLSLTGGYDNRTLSLHQWLGISTALVSILCWLLYRKLPTEKDALSPLRKFRFALLVVMLVLLGIAGHFGGTLTHGKGYLTASLPEPLRRLTGWQPDEIRIENVQEAIVYTDIIQPIFNQRCQSCHGAKKQEGEFALHTLDRLMRGGEGGQVILADNAEGSELHRRLVLPEGHEERMPPKGRTPISDDQIKLIAWWIDQGASSDKRVKELGQPEEIEPILLALEGNNGTSSTTTYGDIPPADQAAIDKLLVKGVKVTPLAESHHYLVVNTINCPEFNDDDSQLLLALGANIAQLKLAGTQITDSALQNIGQLNGLRQLHLENTSISDNGLASLGACKQLSYLNLVNTKVSDEGLSTLTQLPSLQVLYLYQTNVTARGITALAQALPQLEVDTGNYALPALATDTVVYR